MSGGRPTQRELRAARQIGATLVILLQADIVYATLPDGKQLLAKGRDRLDGIIASGVSRTSRVVHVPVLSLETAVALEQQLGGDGAWTQPGPVGHA